MAYTEPTAADLKMRYPAFAAVDDATIDYWLTDAHRYVDQRWSEGDYGPGIIAHAAYDMVRVKVAGLPDSELSGFSIAGVTSFKSGTFQAQFSEAAVKAAIAGGLASNMYGLEYSELLVRNVSTMGVTAPGVVPCGYGCNGYAGPLPPWVCG